jgi:mRNA degradation ribonuclease J1/J2
MEIRILGTGGFANSGLPFNSYLIDGRILVDTPPDILQSLKREGIGLEAIDTVVISHFHGDHFFGLPFLAFNMFLARKSGSGGPAEGKPPPRLIAPPGIAAAARRLLSAAISPDHPYADWFLGDLAPTEIRDGFKLRCHERLFLEFFRTEHDPETYAIIAREEEEGQVEFVSSSDTRWTSRMARIFSLGAKLVLCDGNGKGFGGVHMSPEEIISFVKPLLDQNSRLLVTHLTAYPNEPGDLEYASPGMVLRTGNHSL